MDFAEFFFYDPAMRVSLLATLALLSSCARQPLPPERTRALDRVAVASFLGSSFVVDLESRALLRAKARALDVSPWRVDETFAALLREGIRERGKEYVDFSLEPASVSAARKVRESRWKKAEGKQSQALLDLLFREADAKGIRYFFLLTPLEGQDRFPLHRGVLGATCNDKSAGRDARASVYFLFRFQLWDVAGRKKVFEQAVDPSVTEAMTFGGCNTIADLKDPEKQLEDPVKKTMGLITDALLEKMGWRRPGP